MAGAKERRMALAKLLEGSLPAKPTPKGSTALPDTAIAEAAKALKE